MLAVCQRVPPSADTHRGSITGRFGCSRLGECEIAPTASWRSYEDVHCVTFSARSGGVLHLALVLEVSSPGAEPAVAPAPAPAQQELLRIDSLQLRASK
eukprot:COSAG01_NODE_3771_length_5712_cov_49.079102_8_plen_99_part_00